MDLTWLKQQARRAYWAVETGDVSDLDEFIAPDWRNREAEAEPPAAKGLGPAAFAATIAWLRGAYTELQFVAEESIAEGDTVMSRGDERSAHRRTRAAER
jgi:ketosteroid isomerase-like protein